MSATTLLRIELLKTRKRTAFWAVLAVYSLLLGLDFGGRWHQHTVRPTTHPFALPGAWPTILGQAGDISMFFVPVMIVLLFAAEFSWRTARQNVIDGLSKAEYFRAKLLATLPLIAVFFLVAALLGTVFAGLGTPAGTAPGALLRATDARLAGGVLLSMMGMASIALFFAFAARSTGAGMALALLYIGIAERLVGFAIAALGAPGVIRYLPVQVFQAVAARIQWDPTLLQDAIANAVKNHRPPPELMPTPLLLALSAGYIAAIVGITWWGFRMRDL